MCPLRLILLFLSAALAGFFLFKNLGSSPNSKNPNEAVNPLEESSPSCRSTQVFSTICSGFWMCVDMASGRYLWRNLGWPSSSKQS